MASILDTYTPLKMPDQHHNHTLKSQLILNKTKNIFITNNNNNHKENNHNHAQNDQLPAYKVSRPIALKKPASLLKHEISTQPRVKIRLLVFIEDSDGSRSNIFDSDKFCPQNPSTTSSQYLKKLSTSVNTSNKPRGASKQDGSFSNLFSRSIQPYYKSASKHKHQDDIQESKLSQSAPTSTKLNNEMIKRMVFGSFPMKVSNNTAIKVHSLKTSNKTMISNVFTYYNSNNSNKPAESTCYCDLSPMTSRNVSHTIPINLAQSKTDSIEISSTSSSFNSSSNLNTQNTCSSVPSHYGSYAGLYKRLMRSVSNSLISSTTAVPVENLDSSFDAEKTSLSGLSNCGSQQAVLCEKCIENNCYPKFKIGVAVIFCLPQQTLQRNSSATSTSTSTSTPPSSPISNTPKTPPQLFGSNSINIENQANKKLNGFAKQKSIDPLEVFPASTTSSPSSQLSPLNSPSSGLNLLNNASCSNLDQPLNDKFYEFFFSHLPIIEYQFKEIREKILNHLPNYFLYNPKYQNKHQNLHNHHHHHRQSIASQQSGSSLLNGGAHNKSSSSLSSFNSQQMLNQQAFNLQFSFTRKMISEFEEYEKKFNHLYTSPRLSLPAWLTLINSKKLQSTSNDSQFILNLNPHKSSLNNTICNNLVNDFVYLNKINKNTPSLSTINTNISAKPADFSLLTKLNKIEINLLQNLKNTFSHSHSNPNDSSIINTDKEKLKEKQFLTTLLSTILKSHLSWVYTVLPSNEVQSDDEDQPGLKSNPKLKLRKQRAHWTRILEKTNPYNPLWAQLGDLHGAVNQPLKLVRTVVVGKNREEVEKVLFLLSYFIRCGNSSYFDIVQENFDFDSLEYEDEFKTEINSSSSNSREINITELKFDPITQLTNVLNSSNPLSVKIIPSVSSNSSISSSPSSSHFNTLSSNSNGQNCKAQELPLIGCQLKPNYVKSTRMQDNFGYSLLASYCDEFVFEFVLHGTCDTSFLKDLQQRLVFSKNNSILDTPIEESIYIVVDLDQLEVKTYSSEFGKPVTVEKPIGLVESLVGSVMNMIQLFQTSEFVLLHLEDKLQELYAKSMTLNQIRSQSKEISDQSLMELMEITDLDDLGFLKQILSALTVPNLL